jgi:hypothetical protein
MINNGGSDRGDDKWTRELLDMNVLDSPGYVISLWPLIRMNGGADLLAAYNAFSILLEPHLPPHCELYPPSALHITIATLSSFAEDTTKNTTKEARLIDEAMLGELLNRARRDPEFPVHNTTLSATIRRPTLSEGNVGFFLNEHDHDHETTVGFIGTFEKIRRCLKKASIGTPIEHRIKCPRIVHSTFLRFVNTSQVPKGFRDIFETIAKQWNNNSITISTNMVELVRESVPYMHMHLPARHHIVHQVPMGNEMEVKEDAIPQKDLNTLYDTSN